MSTQKKDQYRETVPHKSHFVPVSVHTTKIEIPTETDGVAVLPEKKLPSTLSSLASRTGVFLCGGRRSRVFY